MRDPYEVLGVPRDATHRQVRAAYRRLARQTHPDTRPADPDASARFRVVQWAYAILGDRARRQLYDHRGHSGLSALPASYRVDEGPTYHSDLGHHSDFYQAGDPLSVAEAAALVGRSPRWLRLAIRRGWVRAMKAGGRWAVRRRDVERLARERLNAGEGQSKSTG